MFCEIIIELFQKIPVELLKPGGYIKKRTFLLTDIGGKCFIYKHKSKISPVKRPKMIKESQKKEDDIKKSLKYHQHWNDWKFQIHGNNLKWVVPKSCNMDKNPSFISSKKFYIKNKTSTNDWVGSSPMKHIDVDELFNRRVIISGLEASFNDDKAIEVSGITQGQTETEVVAYVVQK